METLKVSAGDKKAKYEELLPQIKFMCENEPDMIARMANISAMIMETFNFWWVGFYRVMDDVLVLGPFQGPLACTRIAYGKGVCGTAWKEGKTIIVDDVDAFPGHIACSSMSRSEIVVPINVNGEIVGVLDIDSNEYATFDTTDAYFQEQISEYLAN